MARRVLGESDCVMGRLRAAVHHHGEPVMSRRNEFVSRKPPLVEGEEDSLARGAERQDAVETGPRVEVHHGADAIAVDGTVNAGERRDRRCKRAVNPVARLHDSAECSRALGQRCDVIAIAGTGSAEQQIGDQARPPGLM